MEWYCPRCRHTWSSNEQFPIIYRLTNGTPIQICPKCRGGTRKPSHDRHVTRYSSPDPPMMDDEIA